MSVERTARRLFTGGRRRLARGLTRARIGADPTHPSRDRDAALARLAERPAVLFVCLGNICRSPMAERYLRERAHERGLDLEVRSAGVSEAVDRPSPDDAIEAAAEFDIDLTDHRSATLTDELLEWAGVVFVMDVRNYRALRARVGADGVFFLRPFAGEGLELRDPYGEDIETFRTVYGQLVGALDGLLDDLAAREVPPRATVRGR